LDKPVIHTASDLKGRLHYSLFDSPGAFHRFVKEQSTDFSTTHQKRWQAIVQRASERLDEDTHWYGLPQPQSVSELEGHHHFEKLALLQNASQKLQQKLEKALLALKDQVLQKSVLDYNDRGLGVFSFDRAAMGLYTIPFEKTNHSLLRTHQQLQITLGVDKATSVKKCYAYFKNKTRQYPAITINVLAGGNARVSGEGLYYPALGVAVLSEFLENLGVPVAIQVLIGTRFKGQGIAGVIRVKRFADALDRNQLLLMGSDPKYYRYQGFKGLIALADHFKLTIPQGLGSIPKAFAHQITELLDSKAMVFEQSYTLKDTLDQVITQLTAYTQDLNQTL